MRVVVTESEPGASDELAARLLAAGHQVRRCHDPRHSGAACVALVPEGRCPLEEEPVDVLFDVRPPATPVTEGGRGATPTPREFGAVCAERRGIPLVVLGPAPTVRPFTAARQAATPSEAVLAAEQLVHHLGIEALRAADRAVVRVLRGHRQPTDVTVTIVGDASGPVAVVVHTPTPPPTSVHRALELAARTALMPFTPHWLGTRVAYCFDPAHLPGHEHRPEPGPGSGSGPGSGHPAPRSA